ncbi:MAG: LacI family transcriptional regulator, partial [Eubacteriales bacterium]|nr:LacI family transcriptional regulator [Eubacteriales bacterium]
MRKGRVTIKDVAQAAEVNPSVVSRILNHDETLVVRPETRERVWDAVQQMGYRPNATARSLRTRKNRLIAIVISGFLDPYFALILENANRVADQRGYVVGVLSTESDD